MHYGRLGDTPMFSGDAEAYKSDSKRARQDAESASAPGTQLEGGTIL